MEQHSGRVLYEKNAHTPMRIASITKIMTAILAIESGMLNDEVTISYKATKTEGSSIYLQPNHKIKLEDLLYGLMLRSGNDAAVAIAEHVGGSKEQFVTMMNQKAKEIGMKNTVFANPHGLDDHENHYSSAYDMALLTRYAMKNETYAKIAGTKKYTVKSSDKRGQTTTWINKNRLLTQLYPYCTGGKTGYTQRAKRTLVSTATKDNLDLIAVTINDRNDWNDHMSLFNQAFSNYQPIKIINKEQLPNIDDSFYEGKLKTTKDFIYPLTDSEKKDVSIKVHLIKPSKITFNYDISKTIGTIEINLKDKNIGELPLFLTDLPKQQNKGWWSRLKDSIKN